MTLTLQVGKHYRIPTESISGRDLPVQYNFVIPPDQATTPFTRARRAMQEKYLAEIARRFPAPLLQIPLLPGEIKGLKMLAELGEQLYGASQATPAPTRDIMLA